MDGALTTPGPRAVDRLIAAVRDLKPEIDSVRDELTSGGDYRLRWSNRCALPASSACGYQERLVVPL